jgi:phosphoglycerate dehydrogenase-like enzyme
MDDPVELLITLPFSNELVQHLANVSPRLKITALPARQPRTYRPMSGSGRGAVHQPPPAALSWPRLAWIQFHWAGIDHALSAPICKRPGLVVTSLSGASASQMAEHAVMMLLALGHQLPEAIAHQRRAEWPSDRWSIFLPQELRSRLASLAMAALAARWPACCKPLARPSWQPSAT